MDFVEIHLPRPPHIYLKSIERGADGRNKKFGVLLEPAVEATNDHELYGEIKLHGSAVVLVFKDNMGDFEDPQTMTPEDFEKTWMGD